MSGRGDVSSLGRVGFILLLLFCFVRYLSFSLVCLRPTESTVCSKLPTVTYVLSTLLYLPTYFPEGRGRKRGEWRKIKRSRQQKQQATTTTSTSTSRYLLPFLRITVSVAWYIYLTVCEMYMQCRSKKKSSVDQ